VTFVASTWLAPLLAYISGNYGKVVATTGAASSAAAGKGSPRGDTTREVATPSHFSGEWVGGS